VDVLLNQGAGTFAPAPGSPFAACENNTEADDIVAGQLNPTVNANVDVAVACDVSGGGGIRRLLGDGTGSLGLPESFLTGSVAPLKLGHVSGTPGGDFLYGGNGSACFIPVATLGEPASARCDGKVFGSGLTPVHFYDDECFGGDELLSFSGISTFAGSGLSVREGPTNCTTPFQSSERSSGIVAPNNPTSMAAADLNGDGEPDVVMADSGGAFHVMAWQAASATFGGGIPLGAQPSNFTSAGPIYSLRVADFNGDGCPDIAGSEVLPSKQDAVAIHAGHCNTTAFDAAQTFEVAGDTHENTDLTKMAVGDLNGDGKPDIVTTGGYAGAVTVLLNTTPAPPGSGGVTGGGASGGGTGGGAGAVVGLVTKATIAKETISPSAFAAAPSGPSAVTAKRRYGAKVSYTLNEAASVRFTVVEPQPGRKARGGRCVKPTRTNRRAGKCTRLVAVAGSFTLAGSAGANGFRFTGRLPGRKLKPANYQLLVTPSAGGQIGTAAHASFRIIK
jgi:hypothetical protein